MPREEKILPADFAKDDVASFEYDKEANDRYLPWDILPIIAKHLKPREYFNFRATCKLFKSVVPPCPILEYPSLISYRGNTSYFTLLDPEHSDTYSVPAPESLLGKLICSSKDDYLVMINDQSIVFVNPFTRIQGQLPNSPINLTGPRLSSPPLSDCLVAEISFDFPDTIVISYITTREDEWHTKEFDNDYQKNLFFPIESSTVTYKGMFYVLSENGDLGVFKFDGIEWTWEVLTGLKLPCYTFSNSYLAECDGDLIAVVVCQHGYRVELFKVDFSRKAWERITSLGNYMLFVNDSSSFSTIAKSPRMANKVYFPRLHDGRIVFYSLETRKFHAHGRQKAIHTFCDTEEQLNCAWIRHKGFCNNSDIFYGQSVDKHIYMLRRCLDICAARTTDFALVLAVTQSLSAHR